MRKVTVGISWANLLTYYTQIDDGDPSLDQSGFYGIIRGIWYPNKKLYGNLELLYIGKAYKQTIRKRAKQPHPSADEKMQIFFEKNKRYHKLLLHGWITEYSQERITEQLFSDIEACLINSHHPYANEKSMYSYQGRCIQIINSGAKVVINENCVCSD